MTIRDQLVPALKARFPDRTIKLGEPPEPIAVFAAAHPEVGEVSIWDDGEEATIQIGKLTHSHFNPYDKSMTKDQVANRVTSDVIAFLHDLFENRVRIYSAKAGRVGGYDYIANNGEVRELPADARIFTWSGPWTKK